jgi:hypothetical protein
MQNLFRLAEKTLTAGLPLPTLRAVQFYATLPFYNSTRGKTGLPPIIGPG